jgi:hypothetical protein
MKEYSRVSPAVTKKLFVLEQFAVPELALIEQVMVVSLPSWRSAIVVDSEPPVWKNWRTCIDRTVQVAGETMAPAPGDSE